jgi:predicted nucleotidyltransferase
VAEPTPFPELNTVLEGHVASVRTILDGNFLGAYLQGSFAVGDADEHSDVDFIVVTDDEVTAAQQAALQAMHRRLFRLETPWAQHLEGSYIPRANLRRRDPQRRAFLYLDNGSTELILDNHCNTHVARWSLREHGVTLAGPEPESLVDLVPPEAMRAEVRASVLEHAAWAPAATKAGGMSQWKQTYLVLTFCRMLHTLASGRVVSKKASGEWALETLDPGWRGLIQQALDDRPDPWRRVEKLAARQLVEQTLAFAGYAVGEAA